ncbi:MAG TPA: RCC1 domain-containing protein [Archangium sp.]|nr:RCC1 domain-containing protein [Archangium sp.]
MEQERIVTACSEIEQSSRRNFGAAGARGGGDYHALAVRSDGSVWAWGDNLCG